MPKHPHFRLLLSDIGGVLGTNGWDGELRRKVCEHFNIALNSIDPRHRLTFDTYERGYMDFEQYLKRVFFAEPRSFNLRTLRDVIYAGSVPWFENIVFVNDFCRKHELQLGLVSNEGEGIGGYRIDKFKLNEFADYIVMSYFAHMRKPDPEIWNLALNLAGRRAEETIYLDDRAIFAEAATNLGLTGLHFRGLDDLRAKLYNLGFEV